MKKSLFTLLLTILCISVSAQNQSFITVSGTVSDEFDKLAYVSVAIKGSTLGTITNEDGYFSLKIPDTDRQITLVFSHVGYTSLETDMYARSAHDLKIRLKAHALTLEEAIIISADPQLLIKEALRHIKDNYPMSPVLQRGFYRETARKGNRYINVSEAVIDMFKKEYTSDTEYDNVKVLKGRSLMSPKSADTLAVKLQGGPVLALNLDAVKNKFDLFYTRDFYSYDYYMDTPTVIEERPVYVVNMEPRTRNDIYPLFYAKVYIDKESLAIMRAEYSLDMDSKELATKSILVKKPSAINFTPESVDFIASYRLVDGQAVLHYVRSSIKFKCDWKRRLFSSSYTMVSEMVATDIRKNDITPILYKDTFKYKDSFSDKVGEFSDPDFWGDYNILEPSESLENAVERLMKRVKK